MLMPRDFLRELDADACERFLDSLIVAASGADSYDGELSRDRQRLRQQIERGDVIVEFSEVDETFRLLDRNHAPLEARTF
ncbi:MAG: YheU family protein [Hahellaceae bacterium]|nr:YheU family protein [Hahellaceae bacterium]